MCALKIANKILSFVLIVILLMTSMIGTALADDYSDLDPEEYDVESLEAGMSDRETESQLQSDREPNAIIIKFHPQSMFPGKEKQYDQAVQQVLRWGFEYTPIDGLENTYVVYSTELEKNPNAVMNRFKNNRFIDYVEPNYLGTFEKAPTDPNYARLGAPNAKNINAEVGWDIITDSKVLVAIIDTGYANNSDLPAPFKSWNVLTKNTTVSSDGPGHGTQVAGTVGARANNSVGNVGVIWNANLMPVKVSDASTAAVSNVATGVIWAADNGAKVINLSLGLTTDSATLKSAIDYAFNKGALIVSATGNNASASVSYPAGYANVLGVGGTSNGTTRATSSSYGAGMDVLASWSWNTTTAAGGNVSAGGTSFASPQVAGLAALIWELAPSLTNMQVMQLIRDNTNRSGQAWDSQLGYGTIDMGKTLTAAKALGGAPAPVKDTVPPVITLKGNASMELTEGDTYKEPGYTAIDDVDGDITHLVAITGTVQTAFAGKYTLTYTAIDKAGNTAKATRTVVVKAAPVVSPVKVPPVISQIGSNPIILHLGGSPYVEQGAIATCNVDGDISHLIKMSGTVNTSKAGTYKVTYSVTNSAGLSASVTREVRVLAPKETKPPRTPYNFAVNGKVNASATNQIVADADGNMKLTITVANKTSGKVVISGATGEVFNKTFSGNATVDVWLAKGTYSITGTITEGNGNTNFSMALLMPEVITMTFSDPEVPLTQSPFPGAGPGTLIFLYISLGVNVLLIAALIWIYVRRKKVVPVVAEEE